MKTQYPDFINLSPEYKGLSVADMRSWKWWREDGNIGWRMPQNINAPDDLSDYNLWPELEEKHDGVIMFQHETQVFTGQEWAMFLQENEIEPPP